MKLRRARFHQSLLSRYMLIILMALLFIPIVFPGGLITAWIVNQIVNGPPVKVSLPYGNGQQIEQAWHQEAKKLGGRSDSEIELQLRKLKDKYKDALIFWVDHAGTTRLQLPEQSNLPATWAPEQLIQFMKQRQDYSDPFTVVAFIGGSDNLKQGFMVLELPRSFLKQTSVYGDNGDRYYIFFLVAFLIFFTVVSYLFIRRIRKRLLNLESAMTSPAEDGLPLPTQVGKPDEIGMLEQAFNSMVYQLGDSRRREREEEELRKRLIGNLSHDLRTPLTVIGSHIYSLRQESLSDQGKQSLTLMETKMSDLDHLIDHLLSYNLLSSGRYSITRKRLDILRLVRQSAAAWYPLWEKEGLTPDIELPEQPVYWMVDELAFRRVLDNLFQNIIRHARSGGYVGIRAEPQGAQTALIITDRGPGMTADSPDKGAGLGLTIVELLLREQKLVKEVSSTSEGTCIRIFPEPGS
ncbi:sensor histidine kinase [Paenibacillus sp. CAA11]|uniref:sensor histidine kinase n=1 Tax=Paenibacillus sp. CAA11 TaxID=1532905 RepID=UPI000D37F622|nr:HAMP domain-containing sensor histidine kinase [Paenibacillus sp. CAA11]AWB42919.1 sensor histidine kinase [Paenibacillus sp. CAA11]